MKDQEITITQAEYRELELLRELYNIDSLLYSARQQQDLEQDIDEPIRSIVAMLALLGCEPLWSCCGFDYERQPRHKAHDYGTCGVVVRDNDNSRMVRNHLDLIPFNQKLNKWEVKCGDHYGDNICYISADLISGNPWANRNCIHYSEPGVIAIGLFERFLLSFRSQFADRVVLTDTNKIYKYRYANWQYPPREDWIINKDSIVAKVEESLRGLDKLIQRINDKGD